MKLKDKVIVITGSTRGIGRALAEASVREGARVVISSRQHIAVEETRQTLKQGGFQVSALAADVSVQEDLERVLQHAVETWGRVDVWVNNAGLSSGLRPLDEISAEEIETIVNVNLTAMLKACRLVIPYLIKQPGGGILINLSGKGGRGEPSPFLTTYSATKAAVTNLTKSLAGEYRSHPISIHALMPGMVRTDFYKDMKTSPKLMAQEASLPYVFKAMGTSAEEVARLFVEIAAQVPGKATGKTYSLLRGPRLIRGIALLTLYRAIRRI